MLATRIKMKPGCGSSNNLLEIDEIYLIGNSTDRFYKKEVLHDYLAESPNTIQVNISPYPPVIPSVSQSGEKYVRSSPNGSTTDNLLKLPRV